eukprot:g1149.t1
MPSGKNYAARVYPEATKIRPVDVDVEEKGGEEEADLSDTLRFSYAIILSCKDIEETEGHGRVPESPASGDGTRKTGSFKDAEFEEWPTMLGNESLVPRASVVARHVKVVSALQRSGLRVALLKRNTHQTCVVLLVSASGRRKDGAAVDDRGLLLLEKKRRERVRYVRSGMLAPEMAEKDFFGQVFNTDNGSGSSCPPRTLKELGITRADEVAYTDTIIKHSLSTVLTHDFDEVSKHLLSIVRVFPLHDKVFNSKIHVVARETPFLTSGFWWSLPSLPQRWKSGVFRCCRRPNLSSGRAHQVATVSAKNKKRTIREFVDLIHDHFGMPTAIYFNFLAFYTKCLVPLAICLTVFYASFRFYAWNEYVSLLAIVGTAVTAIWGPWLVCAWRRENARLLLRWNVESRSRRSEESAESIPNPHSPDYELRVDMESPSSRNGLKRVYDPNHHRVVVNAGLPVLFIVNGVFMSAIVILFVQFWAYGKMSPTCECCNYVLSRSAENASWLEAAYTNMNAWSDAPSADCMQPYDLDAFRVVGEAGGLPDTCEHFVNCFKSARVIVFVSDRWYMILIQGIVMGLTIDILQLELFLRFMRRLTIWENWPSMREFKQNCMRKSFPFVWVNLFVWYDFVALIAVPFGAYLQERLIEFGFGFLVPPHGWKDRVVSVDEALVTPLVATAFLNLALQTFVPFLISKLMHRQSVLEKNIRRRLRSASKLIGGVGSNGGYNSKYGGENEDASFTQQSRARRALSRAIARDMRRADLCRTSSQNAIVVANGATDTKHIANTTKNDRVAIRSLLSAKKMTSAAVSFLRRRRSMRRMREAASERMTARRLLGPLRSAMKARLNLHVPKSFELGASVKHAVKVSAKKVKVFGKTIVALHDDKVFAKIATAERALEELWTVASNHTRNDVNSEKKFSCNRTIATVSLVDLLREDVDVVYVAQSSVLRPLVSRDIVQQKMLSTLPTRVRESQLRRFCISENLFQDYEQLKERQRERFLVRYGKPRCMRGRENVASSERRRSVVLDHQRREILAAQNRVLLAQEMALKIRIESLKILKRCTTDDDDDDDSGDDEIMTRNAYPLALVHGVNDGKDEALHMSLEDASPDRNAYDAVEVVEQSHLPVFQTQDDILDMLLQLGYILQFSVAWPFTFACGMINNYFEIHCDLFRCTRASSRPVPQFASSIEEWTEPLWWLPFLSVPISAALVVFATGQIERWSRSCPELMVDDVMGTEWECFSNPLLRWIVFLVLIFAQCALILVVYFALRSDPPDVRRADKCALRLRQTKLAEILIPRLPEDLRAKLRNAFDAFCLPGRSTMRRSDLKRLMDMIQKSRGLETQEDTHALRMLYDYMDVMKRGEIHFHDFASGLAHARSDYNLRFVLKLEEGISALSKGLES